MDDGLPVTAMEAWLRECTGARSVTVQRRPGGGRHQAWDVTLAGADGVTDHRFLRADAIRPGPHESYTLWREAEIYAALAGAGLPVPDILAVHPDHPAVLMAYAPGGARFSGLEPGAQVAILDELVDALVRMHRLDVATLPLPTLLPGAERRRPRARRARRVGGPPRPERPGGALPARLLRLAARGRPRRRRPAVAGAGRHRPGQLPPRRRAPHRAARLRARPPGRPDGGPGVDRHPQRPGAGARLRRCCSPRTHAPAA